MATKKISAAKFTNLKAGDKDQLISDGDSLFISIRSVSNGGAKSFRMAYRIGGEQKWLTLKAVALADARRERDTYKIWVSQGKDPGIERDLELERMRQQQLAEQGALAKLNARITVSGLFSQLYDTRLNRRKDCVEVKRMFDKDILPVIGELFVEDVRKQHITQITNPLVMRGVNVMANRVFSLTRQMFQFAVDQGIITANPTAGLSKAKIGGKETERDRVLNEAEIRALARQLPDAKFMKATECAVWIALSTLCRVGELSKAQWADVDMESGTWRIPEANSKNGKAHTIYLSSFALAQFKMLAAYATSDVWLFPSRDNTHHVCEKSITKQIQGRQTQTVLSGRSKHSQALVLPNGCWTPHDLRRTGATLMGELGVMSEVIEKCLNHTEENKVKRIYQRQELKTEQAAAWWLLGEHINLLIQKDNSNVVPITKKSA